MTSKDTRYDELPTLYTPNAAARMKPQDLFLGERFGQAHNGDWWLRQSFGTWTVIPRHEPAMRACVQHWGGPASIHQLTDQDVKTFMDKHAPVIRGGIICPNSASHSILFRGDIYINAWRDSTMKADPQALDVPELRQRVEQCIRMFRENLCGRVNTLDLTESLLAAEGNLESELEWRFFMSFLAQALQDVGCNMQVNMWLLGMMGGIGKGILTSMLLPMMFGAEYVAEINPEEIENRGWMDTLAGKLWIIVNELNPSTPKKGELWNSFIKRYSTEPVLRITKRNNHSFECLNVANWIFTSNNEQPRCLDAKDRRNALIQTTNDDSRKELALDLYLWMHAMQEANPLVLQRFLGGLVHVLKQHPVDSRLLKEAPATLLKQDVQEGTSVELKGMHWLRNDDSYERDHAHPAEYFMQFYNRFVRPADQVDSRGMGLIFSALNRHGGLVKRLKPYPTKSAYWEVPSEYFPRATDADEATKQQADQKVVNLAGRLPAPKRR